MIFLIIFGGLVILGLVAWILINTFSRALHGGEGEEQGAR